MNARQPPTRMPVVRDSRPSTARSGLWLERFIFNNRAGGAAGVRCWSTAVARLARAASCR